MALKNQKIFKYMQGCLEQRARLNSRGVGFIPSTTFNSFLDYTDELILKLINSVPDQQLPIFMALAIYAGDHEIFNLVKDRYRRAPNGLITSTKYHDVKDAIALFAENIQPFACVRGASEARDILESVQQFGFQWMTEDVEGKPFLLRSIKKSSSMKINRDSPLYSGLLPTLSADLTRVHNPELLIALKQQRDSSRFPKAYESVLCLVPIESIDTLSVPHRRLVPFQSFSLLEGSTNQSLCVPFGEWDDDTLIKRLSVEAGDRQCAITGLQMGLTGNTESTPLYRISLERSVDDYLKSAFLPKRAQMGFNEFEGFTICTVKLDDLLNLDLDGCNDQHLEQAKAHCDQVLPLNLICNFYSNDGSIKFGRGYDEEPYMLINSLSDLLDHLAHPEYSNLVKDTLSHAVWHQVLKPAYTINGLHAAAIELHLGISSDNRQVTVSMDDLDKLVAIGYRVDPGKIGKLKESDRNYPLDRDLMFTDYDDDMTAEDYRSAVFKMMDLGAIVDEELHHLPLKDILVKAARRKLICEQKAIPDAVLTKRIMQAGPEQCAAVASSKAQWNTIEKVLGKDAIRPYLRMASKRVKGDFLSDDLGL